MLLQRLQDLTEHIVPAGTVGCNAQRLAHAGERVLVVPAFCQQLSTCSQRTRMLRRKCDEGIDPAFGIRITQARHLDLGQIEVGIRQLRIDIDGTLCGGNGLVETPEVVQQKCQIAVGFGIVRPQDQGTLVAGLRRIQLFQAFVGVAQVVVRLVVVRLQRHDALQTFQTGVEFSAFLQDDAQIVPCANQFRIQSHGESGGLLRLCQQAFLTAHFGQIAVIRRRCHGDQASLAQIIDRQIQLAIGMRDQSKLMQRVRLRR